MRSDRKKGALKREGICIQRPVCPRVCVCTHSYRIICQVLYCMYIIAQQYVYYGFAVAYRCWWVLHQFCCCFILFLVFRWVQFESSLALVFLNSIFHALVSCIYYDDGLCWIPISDCWLQTEIYAIILYLLLLLLLLVLLLLYFHTIHRAYRTQWPANSCRVPFVYCLPGISRLALRNRTKSRLASHAFCHINCSTLS